jgi:hypothetical protein
MGDHMMATRKIECPTPLADLVQAYQDAHDELEAFHRELDRRSLCVRSERPMATVPCLESDLPAAYHESIPRYAAVPLDYLADTVRP